MRLVRLALFGAAITAASACTSEGGAGFFIVHNQAPEEGCVIPTDVSSLFLSVGKIDSNATSGYLFTPVVQSLFQASGTGDVDHVIFVQGADVSLTTDSGESLGSFRQMFSGSIFPNSTTSFGFEILPHDTLVAVGAGRVHAEISMFGTADGEDIDAEPYFYTIEVCDGCLSEVLDTCDIPDGYPIQTGGACQLLQDGFVTCCMDETLGLLCPAPDSTGA
jgi:hypothetical protein